MFRVLVLFYSTMIVFSILTVCCLPKVCTTAYYVTSMMGIQEFMYYHAHSTRAMLQHYDGFPILTVCYLSKVCTTAYYVISMMGIQEFMYYHAYSTRAVLQHYDGFLHLDRVLPI